MRVTMEDRPKVRVGEAQREHSPFRAHAPVRPQAELRPTAFNLPEPARATPLAAPTPPPQQQGEVSHQPMRAEDLSPTARLLEIKQEERERSAVQASERPRAVPPVAERPRPPVEAPVRAEELSLSARLQKIKEEEARRQASKPDSEPPRAMSMTERLMQATGDSGGASDAIPTAKPGAPSARGHFWLRMVAAEAASSNRTELTIHLGRKQPCQFFAIPCAPRQLRIVIRSSLRRPKRSCP